VGIAQITEKSGYKILKWAALVVGCLLFAVGGFLSLSTMSSGGGSSNIPPDSIHFTAPGIVHHADAGYYHMSVFQKHTSIMVNTGPWGSARRVTFEIQQGAEYLEITPTIWPGSMATITLIGDQDNPYQFGQTVIILVKSGQAQEFLHVRIDLPPEQVSFQFRLWNDRNNVTISEISASTYFWDVYSDYPISTSSSSRFRFTSVLNVFGGIVDGARFSASAQGVDHGIRLFGIPVGEDHPSGISDFTNVFIPIEVLYQIIDDPRMDASMTFRFMISAEYLGDHIDFFELRIVK